MTHIEEGRRVENVLAYGGFLLFALYVVAAEVLPHLGLSGCPTGEHGVPWGMLAGLLVCVAPKTLGRAGASGVLGAVLQFVPGSETRRFRKRRDSTEVEQQDGENGQ